MTSAAAQHGALPTALANAGKLLAERPAAAEMQAREILKVVPRQRDAERLLASALRRQGRLAEALQAVESVTSREIEWAPGWLETGMIHAAAGDAAPAVQALRRAVQFDPLLPEAWRLLGDLLTTLGEKAAAADAYAYQVRASVRDTRLLAAAAALGDGRLAVAERLLRDFLKAHPTDVAAIRMLAEVGARLGRYGDSERLLERCLELAPTFNAARLNYALVLLRLGKAQESIVESDRLLQQDPSDPAALSLKASALGRVGEYAQAVACYEEVLQAHPEQPKAWMSLGHTLKTIGRRDDCITAYRRSIALLPSLGEAWWSLANMKTFRFTPAELEEMQRQLARTDISQDDRLHLHFALGKALEDAADYPTSFDHYARANAIRRGQVYYQAEETTDHVARSRVLFTREFFAEREGAGSPARDPIFVVGLPRAGSTLVEQILSSHSAIEGTMELPDITALAKRLGGKRGRGDHSAYPDSMAALDRDQLRELGEEYLERTRVQRKTARPLFIDKMPNNFAHLGLIHLALPNARIIDVRRHPLGCGFSCFKQHFARGQEFSFSMEDIGRFYADYVALLDHFDEVLPGRVCRVIYEDLIDDPRTQVERLLDYCGLPFEDACLQFHTNDRAVRTASSEQVRQPIYREALDQWRHFEPWLDPLRTALGPALDNWRNRDTPAPS